MKVPLTIGDFLRRGAAVYADRPAVYDEPGTQGSLGTISYRQLASRARGLALALDELGISHGERVAIVSPNAARFQIAYFGVSGYGRVLVPINYRLNADEISYIVEHSGTSVLLVDPDSDEALKSVTAKHRIVLDGEADAALFAEAPDGRNPRPGSPTRTPPRASTTPAARPRGPRASSSRTGTAGSTPPRSAGTPGSATGTCSCTRCRCSTATAGACRTRSRPWASRR